LGVLPYRLLRYGENTRKHTAGRQNKTFEAKLAVNALGVITGSFFDQDGVVHGFVRIQ